MLTFPLGRIRVSVAPSHSGRTRTAHVVPYPRGRPDARAYRQAHPPAPATLRHAPERRLLQASHARAVHAPIAAGSRALTRSWSCRHSSSATRVGLAAFHKAVTHGSGSASSNGCENSVSSTKEGPDRPLIGLTAYQETAAWGVWQAPASLLAQTYVDHVKNAGGIPMLLPAA